MVEDWSQEDFAIGNDLDFPLLSPQVPAVALLGRRPSCFPSLSLTRLTVVVCTVSHTVALFLRSFAWLSFCVLHPSFFPGTSCVLSFRAWRSVILFPRITTSSYLNTVPCRSVQQFLPQYHYLSSFPSLTRLLVLAAHAAFQWTWPESADLAEFAANVIGRVEIVTTGLLVTLVYIYRS